MNVGKAKVKTDGRDGAFMEYPVDNPLLNYDDWVAFQKNTHLPTHILGFENGLEILTAENSDLPINLSLDNTDSSKVIIDFTDLGNAKEGYEVAAYLVVDIED